MRLSAVLLSICAVLLTIGAGSARAQSSFVMEPDGFSHADRYAQSQILRASLQSRRVPAGAAPAIADKPRMVKSQGAASSDAAGASAVSMMNGVSVFRGSRPGTAQSCGMRTTQSGVTVYAACQQGWGSELAGGWGAAYADSAPARSDSVLTVAGAVQGNCAVRIRATPAMTGESGRVEVCYRDLQPVQGKRVSLLYDRIEEAAARACGSRAGYGGGLRHAGCEAQAVDVAIYESGLPALVDFHQAAIGRGPQIFVGSRRF